MDAAHQGWVDSIAEARICGGTSRSKAPRMLLCNERSPWDRQRRTARVNGRSHGYCTRRWHFLDSVHLPLQLPAAKVVGLAVG